MRRIGSEYELPDYDDDDNPGGMLRHRRRHTGRWLALFAALVLAIGGVYLSVRVTTEQRNDAFCLGCHTEPETAYVERSIQAMAGALAVDLSSYHYQQIRGQGGALHCIQCHEGNASLGHRVEVYLLSARNSYLWLAGQDDRTLEKLRLTTPHLTNDSCLSCHAETVLVAGMDNHQHNMLPATYALWRDGARLIAPPGAVDRQAIIAAGLALYPTNLTCADCHQTHRSLETELFLDRTDNLPTRCVQCHTESGEGPLEVELSEER